METIVLDKAYRKIFTEIDVLIEGGRKVKFYTFFSMVLCTMHSLIK